MSPIVLGWHSGCLCGVPLYHLLFHTTIENTRYALNAMQWTAVNSAQRLAHQEILLAMFRIRWATADIALFATMTVIELQARSYVRVLH